MDPKKQPAVSSDTTLEEIWAFLSSLNPDESTGRPKSFLKLERARTEPITPVS
jgi:hypothetical protein